MASIVTNFELLHTPWLDDFPWRDDTVPDVGGQTAEVLFYRESHAIAEFWTHRDAIRF